MKKRSLPQLFMLTLLLLSVVVGMAMAAVLPMGQQIPAMDQKREIAEVPADPILTPAPIIPQTAALPPPTTSLTDVLLAIIGLTTVVLTTFVAPWLKASRSEKQLRHMVDLADIAVRSAWDYLKSRPGEERLQYAIGIMQKKGFRVDVPGVLDALKASWVNLKAELSSAGINTDGTDRFTGEISGPAINNLLEDHEDNNIKE